MIEDTTPAATHGGPRAGSGRPSISAEPTERHSVTAPASMWRYIEQAGNGNRSAGLRKIVEIAMSA